MKKSVIFLAIVVFFSVSSRVSAEELQSFVVTKNTTLLELVSEFSDTSIGFFFGYTYDSTGDFYGWNKKSEEGIEYRGKEVFIKKGTAVKVPKSWKRLVVL